MQSSNVISYLPLHPQNIRISRSPDLTLSYARPPAPFPVGHSFLSHKNSPNRCSRSCFGRGGLDASMWPLFMESHGHPNVATPVQGPLSDDSVTFPSLAAKCLPTLNLLYSHQHSHSYRSAVYATVLPTQTISTKEICEDESRLVILGNGEKIHETQIYSPHGKDFELPKNCTRRKRQLHKRKNEAPETSMQVTFAVPGYPSVRHVAQNRQNSGEYNKQSLCMWWQHRARITEGMRVLHEIIAPVKKLRREAVLEAVIDYAKKLKLQIEVMSHNKGGDGGKSDVFTGTEGCSFHLVNEQTTKEPLDATLAKLIECDMKSACGYLNSRGLALVPMAAIAHLPDY